jgi:hypothetical protein
MLRHAHLAPSTVGALLLGTLLALHATVLAYPPQVANILRSAGQSAVLRGTGTIDDNTKKELETIASSTASRTGGKVYFIIAKKDEPIRDFDGLYEDLGLKGKDMIVVSNGPGWSLHCNALDRAQKEGILANAGKSGARPLEKMRMVANDAASAVAQAKAETRQLARTGGQQMTWNEFQHANAGRGWSSRQMSEAYARYQRGASYETIGQPTTTGNPSSGSGNGLWIFLGVVAAIVVVWVVVRRRNRDQSLATDMKAALGPPEAVMADVYMNLDESHPRFGQLIEQATAVSGQIDQIKGQAPSREGISRLRSLEEQARGLRRAVEQR